MVRETHFRCWTAEHEGSRPPSLGSFHCPWNTDIPGLTLGMLQAFELAKQEEGSETCTQDPGMKGRRKKRRMVKILLLSQTRTIDTKLVHSTLKSQVVSSHAVCKTQKSIRKQNSENHWLQIHTVWFVKWLQDKDFRPFSSIPLLFAKWWACACNDGSAELLRIAYS